MILMKNFKINFNICKYVLPSYKLAYGSIKKVILIADLHNYTKSLKNRRQLAENIKERNPDHIVIAGDSMQGIKWEKNIWLDKFKDFLADLSEQNPVFISQGNHDLVGINSKNYNQRIGNFRKLADVRPGMIYPLVNDKVIIDNFEIIGYTPSYHIISGLGIQKHGFAHDQFINEYDRDGIKPSMETDNIVEFVGHNPHLIAQSENGIGLGSLSSVDTFYTGHLHNGSHRSSTISKNPDRFLDNGFVERPFTQNKDGKVFSFNPLIYGLTNLCRGVVYIDDRSQQQILQLSNGHFYKNVSKKDNVQKWKRISSNSARIIILSNKFKALIITGGVNKFFNHNIFGDQPEITETIYEGRGKILIK